MKTNPILRAAAVVTSLLILAGCETTETSRVTAGAPPEAAKKTLNLPAFDSETAEAAPSLDEGVNSPQSPLFKTTFDPDWNRTQTDWQVATWLQNGTQMSPERCRTNEDGHLVQTVLAG
jgi:hypothetical protein